MTSSNVDIMMIGHFAKDRIVVDGHSETMSGGAVYYGSIPLRQIGVEVATITRLYPDDFPRLDELKQAGVQVFAVSAPETSGIENIYDSVDMERRICKPMGFAGSFQATDIPNISARIYAVVPIIAGEVDLPLLKALALRGPVALDVQGFVRVKVGDELVFRPWPEMKEGLAQVTYLKVDRAEAELLTGLTDLSEAAYRLAEYGPREVVITESSGVTVYAGGQIYQAPFTPRSLAGRTGRGDTCFAIYLGKRLTTSAQEATRWAGAVATLKQEKPGPWSGSVAEIETILAHPQHQRQSEAGYKLAARYAPILKFDANEPFLPVLVGYTIFRESGDSPSFPRRIELIERGQPRAAMAIEYAIWWDWDIGHLYELEHIWVYLDAQGQVIRAEASWHGRYHDMAIDGQLPLTGERLTILSEPGKHAFAPSRDWLDERAPTTRRSCTRFAGGGGVWLASLFKEIVKTKTPEADRLVHTYLEKHAFEPAMEFTQIHPIRAEILLPWPALFEWIPRRLAWWVSELERTIPPAERRYLRIAHRGASLVAPPSSAAAIARAVELGADMVELDVQMSADGVPVIAHPADIRRLAPKICTVSEHTLSELKKLDLGHGETMLTLEEAIICCREHGVGLYLELKGNWVVKPVVEAIRQHHLLRRVLVSSFRPDWLADIKALEPKITTSVLFSSVNIDAVALARAVGAQYVHPCWERQVEQPHKLLTPAWIGRVRAAGLGLITWHEERPDEIAALRRLGVDGICSDAPDLLL